MSEVQESTALAVTEQPQQLITIEPAKYVELVFEPFAKQYADAIDAVREVAYDIKTTAGMATAIKHRAVFRDIRVASEKARKLRKAPILEIGKLLDSRQGDIEATTLPLETMFDDEIKDEEGRKEAEKQAKLATEQARITAIKAKIEAFMLDAVSACAGTVAQIDAYATRLSETVISLDEYAEYTGEAQVKRDNTVKWLRERQQKAAEQEAEAARIAAEREQLARERAEAAERERIAAAARAEQEAKDRAERERIVAEQRAAQERATAAMRAQQEAHERRMAAEREAANAAWLAQHEAEQASLRAQQEAADKLAAATSEIQGIQQQAMIATLGRSGVRKGGTIECIRETLTETEAWEIDPERFGVLAGAAEMAKATAVAEIRRLLADAEAREVAEVEERRKREAEAVEQARREREARESAEAEAREKARRIREDFELNGPHASEMIEVLAAHYQVEQETVLNWINRWVWAEVEVAA